MLQEVEWGEYRLGDLFEVCTYKKRFDANKVHILESGEHPYIVRMSSDNGQKGFINEDVDFLNDGNTLSFGQDTATVFYQEKPYFTGDKIKVLKCKSPRFGKQNAQFFVAAIFRAFHNYSWGTSSYNVEIIEGQKVSLPVENGEINFPFMEKFIAELEAQRIAELEAYLLAAGLSDYTLTEAEKDALQQYKDKAIFWSSFNLKKLFGRSTRGKRLKSADRIPGELPFVTAGEAEEGVSAYIGNNVKIFSGNTTTIDMFGSAKYRCYDYGGDDHIAVVHTENLPKCAAIFVTTAAHKAAHTGKFNYGHNFYAKDADALDIMLPSRDGQPDYACMERLISAIQKMVIKDVVLYAEAKVNAAKTVVTG